MERGVGGRERKEWLLERVGGVGAGVGRGVGGVGWKRGVEDERKRVEVVGESVVPPRLVTSS